MVAIPTRIWSNLSPKFYAAHKIWSRLTNWPHRYSSLKMLTTDNGRRTTTDDGALLCYKLILWAFGSCEIKLTFDERDLLILKYKSRSSMDTGMMMVQSWHVPGISVSILVCEKWTEAQKVNIMLASSQTRMGAGMRTGTKTITSAHTPKCDYDGGGIAGLCIHLCIRKDVI